MGRGTERGRGSGVSPATGRVGGRVALVAAGCLAAYFGRAWRSAEVFRVERAGGSGRKTHFAERRTGEFAGSGADTKAPAHQRSGSPRIGSRLAQIKVVNGQSNRRIHNS